MISAPPVPPGALAVPLHGFLPDNSRGIRAWALVDEADRWVLDHRWHMDANGYARRIVTIGKKRQRAVLMARAILGLEYGDKRMADHIDRSNTLDNRRSNLRIVDRRGQNQNRSGWGEVESRGVAHYSDGRSKPYQAYGHVPFRDGSYRVNLGSFETEEAAAEQAQAFRQQYLPFATD